MTKNGTLPTLPKSVPIREFPRQRRVENACGIQGKLRTDTAIGVDDRGDPGIGDTNERQSTLDSANARHLQMLVGTGRVTEPGIIREVEQPLRLCGRGGPIAGENRLVADRRPKCRRAGRGQDSGPGTRQEVRRPRRQFLERQYISQRHVLAERHEAHLVVDAHHVACARDCRDAVENARAASGLRFSPDGARDQNRACRQQIGGPSQDICVIEQQTGRGGLGPERVGRPDRRRFRGQFREPIDDGSTLIRPPLQPLRYIRLNESQPHAVDDLIPGSQRQAEISAKPQDSHCEAGCTDRSPTRPPAQTASRRRSSSHRCRQPRRPESAPRRPSTYTLPDSMESRPIHGHAAILQSSRVLRRRATTSARGHPRDEMRRRRRGRETPPEWHPAPPQLVSQAGRTGRRRQRSYSRSNRGSKRNAPGRTSSR